MKLTQLSIKYLRVVALGVSLAAMTGFGLSNSSARRLETVNAVVKPHILVADGVEVHGKNDPPPKGGHRVRVYQVASPFPTPSLRRRGQGRFSAFWRSDGTWQAEPKANEIAVGGIPIAPPSKPIFPAPL